MSKRRSKRRGSSSLSGGLIAVLLVVGLIGTCARDPEPEPEPSRSVSAAVDELAAPEPTPEPTDTPEPTATPYRIHGRDPAMKVYVSRKNVIHFRSDCSGMKYYTEMTLEQAAAAGFAYCDHCT
jgi:hypothetical protein